MVTQVKFMYLKKETEIVYCLAVKRKNSKSSNIYYDKTGVSPFFAF